ncbi:PREDICTED: uncharacterized protein LOC103343374 [Prunus mume]|uniref:Uncharacterized protein LOC103343374 n=1 Tax=Prunus mume TaxID=102107 RepID=A0ABM1LYN9_PRUMU|nr:PREDICTED: uncharacterized protein LOC103343374 [Prunus mume]
MIVNPPFQCSLLISYSYSDRKMHCYFCIIRKTRELLDIKPLPSMELQSWSKARTKRAQFFKPIPRSLFDLVDKCLTVNPRLRINAQEAVRHKFLASCLESLRRQKMFRREVMSTQNDLLVHEVKCNVVLINIFEQ